MQRPSSLFVAAAFVVLAAAGAQAAEPTTLVGEYVWEGGAESGALEAVFTPTATEGEWDVAFHFDFRGAHTYSGTASGSLTSGTLSGTVRNEDKGRTFTFSGTFDEGRFSGTHAETTGGRASRTGTLTLGR